MQNMLKILAVIAILMVASVPAYAQDAENKLQFVVVNMQEVIKSSVALKSVEEQLSEKRKALQVAMTKEEQKLRAEDDALKEQKETAPEAEFKERVAKFKEKILDAQKKAQEGKAKYDRAYNAALRALRIEATKVVGDIAKERKVSMVLSNDAVILSEKELDITKEAIKRLNAKLKTLPLNWE